jgi:hypothetical protein
MRRSKITYLLSAALLTTGASALTFGCADNDSSMFVVGVVSTDAANCVAKPDTTALFLSQGTLDVAFASSYTGVVLVGNQLTARGSREQIRTETSRVSLKGAEVTLTTVDGRTIRTYSTVGTGFVDPAAGDTPGYGLMAVNMLPSQLSADAAVRAAGVVIAKVRVFGNTLGGQSVTSSELDFPIRVCEGCLIRYPSEAVDPADPPKCKIASDATTDVVVPCSTGQDAPIACTLCSASYDICRDPALNPSYAP